MGYLLICGKNKYHATKAGIVLKVENLNEEKTSWKTKDNGELFVQGCENNLLLQTNKCILKYAWHNYYICYIFYGCCIAEDQYEKNWLIINFDSFVFKFSLWGKIRRLFARLFSLPIP